MEAIDLIESIWYLKEEDTAPLVLKAAEVAAFLIRGWEESKNFHELSFDITTSQPMPPSYWYDQLMDPEGQEIDPVKRAQLYKDHISDSWYKWLRNEEDASRIVGYLVRKYDYKPWTLEDEFWDIVCALAWLHGYDLKYNLPMPSVHRTYSRKKELSITCTFHEIEKSFDFAPEDFSHGGLLYSKSVDLLHACLSDSPQEIIDQLGNSPVHFQQHIRRLCSWSLNHPKAFKDLWPDLLKKAEEIAPKYCTRQARYVKEFERSFQRGSQEASFSDLKALRNAAKNLYKKLEFDLLYGKKGLTKEEANDLLNQDLPSYEMFWKVLLLPLKPREV